MRFPLGVLSQYIGRKNAALVEMGLIVAALAFGYLAVDTYDEVILMGVLLGIAGASFGVALSLGSGWFPPATRGLAMGRPAPATRAPCWPCCSRRRWPCASAGRPSWLRRADHAAADGGDVVRRQGAAGSPSTRLPPASPACRRDGWAFSLIYVVTFWRLHRPGELPAHLLLRPVQGHQGRGRPAHHAGHADGLGGARGRRLDLRPHRRRQHALRRAGRVAATLTLRG